MWQQKLFLKKNCSLTIAKFIQKTFLFCQKRSQVPTGLRIPEYVHDESKEHFWSITGETQKAVPLYNDFKFAFKAT